MNYITAHKEALSKNNYVRAANARGYYWFDFSLHKIKNYEEKFGDDFNLIISGSEAEEGDFYIIPFSLVRDVFTEDNLSISEDEKRPARWVGKIRNHKFLIFHSD